LTNATYNIIIELFKVMGKLLKSSEIAEFATIKGEL